jgi:hypothetical protein
MPQITRTFTDPENPAKSVTVTLKKMEPHEIFEAAKLSSDMVKKYVTGDTEEDTAPLAFPMIFNEDGTPGEPVKLNDFMCMAIAQVVIMQIPQPGEAPYNFEELVAMSYTFPHAFKGINKIVGELEEKRIELSKNRNGAGTLPLSDSPSIIKQETTLTLSLEETQLQEASTHD